MYVWQLTAVLLLCFDQSVYHVLSYKIATSNISDEYNLVIWYLVFGIRCLVLGGFSSFSLGSAPRVFPQQTKALS